VTKVVGSSPAAGRLTYQGRWVILQAGTVSIGSNEK
jgi:hypothetical protein